MNFVRVEGPFRRAERTGIPILEIFERDLASGEGMLEKLVSETQTEISAAGSRILYVLSGPEPAKATPMQYGGLFLEKDRELLNDAGSKTEVWLLIEAGPDAYLDFVSDLPAEVLCWNSRKTGFPLQEMRKLRPGRLCTNDPGSDEDFSMFECGTGVEDAA